MPYKDKQKKIEADKEYREKNKEILREKARIRYLNNRKETLKRVAEYRKENREKIIEYKKRNRTKHSIKEKEYRARNKDKVKEWRMNYNKRRNEQRRERRKTDIQYAIKENIRASFHKHFKKRNLKKEFSINKYEIDIKAIVEHLGTPPDDGKVYHIDHILPVDAFDLTKQEQIKKCWAPENLRWLEASENLKKSNKYRLQEFKEYVRIN